MIIQSLLLRKILADIRQERIQTALKDIADKIKKGLLTGDESLHVMKLKANYDYTPRKWWFQKLKPVHLNGVGREVFQTLQKMGLKPQIGEKVCEDYNLYEIRLLLK
jgi:hypothetical protein